MRTCTAVLQHTGQVRPCLRITSRLHTPRLSGLHEAHCPTTACCVHCADIQSTQSLRCGLLPNIQCCFTSTETVRTIRDGEPRTATSTLTQLLNYKVEILLTYNMLSDTPANLLLVCVNMLVENDSKRNFTFLWLIVPPRHCRFTFSETVRTIRDGEPRMSTSSLTHLCC